MRLVRGGPRPRPRLTRARLVHRRDDTEAVLIRRLREHHEKMAPLVPYYERLGMLRRVDGLGTVAEVKRRALAALGIEATVHA